MRLIKVFHCFVWALLLLMIISDGVFALQNQNYVTVRILSRHSLNYVNVNVIKGYLKLPTQYDKLKSIKICANKNSLDIYCKDAKVANLSGFYITAPDKIVLTKIYNKKINRIYKGEIKVYASNNELILINTVDLEDYLKSVVPSEMPFKNIEALKAQAVVSRTYAIKNSGKHKRSGYNFCDLTCCQVYYGTKIENLMANKAVELTRGEIITYNGKPIAAFYHSTCGGVLADKRDVFKGKKLPYYQERQDRIKGSKDDNCSISNHYKWSVTYSDKQLIKALKEYDKKIKEIDDLKITSSSRAGIVRTMEIKSKDKVYKIDAQSFRDTCGSTLGWGGIESVNFKIEKKKNLYTFKGHGCGHLLGMCQWGAYGMALKKKKYKEILMHYFPKTVIGNFLK